MIVEYHGGRFQIKTSVFKGTKAAGVWDSESPTNPVYQKDTRTEGIDTMWDCKRSCVDFIREEMKKFRGAVSGDKVEVTDEHEHMKFTFIRLHERKEGIVLLRVPSEKRLIEKKYDEVIWPESG